MSIDNGAAVDSNSNQGSLQSITDDDTKRQVLQVSKTIYSTMTVNASKTKAQMKIPPIEEWEREVLALALERILAQTFKISMPSKVMMKIREGRPAKFLVKPVEDLPPLTVIILLDRDKQQLLSIRGVEPIHGTHGYSVLIFQWEQKSGVVDDRGNIDLKKINKLPGVKSGSLLAKIYEHTPGQPGISCLGKRLKQSVGKPITVKFDEESVSRIEDADGLGDTSSFQLYARKGGIVQYSLSQEKNPKTLRKIAIRDTVVINGDVDYGVGDQGEMSQPELGCESNIIIEGSVRGVFSVQSNGYIQVKKAIEGTVAANEVETELITGGSSVTAKKNITAGSIINATAKAQNITVKENTNGSCLLAAEKVIFEERANCMALKVATKGVESKANRFSGVNVFSLGEDLFVAIKKHVEAIRKVQKKLNEYGGPLKEMAATIVDHLALLNSITRKGTTKVDPEVLRILDRIKAAIVTGFQSVEASIDENVVPAAHRLQELLSRARFDESVLRKVDLLTRSITKYNQKEKEIGPYVKEMAVHKKALADLRGQLANDLEMQFTDVELLSASTELRITCGEAELVLGKQDLPARSFTIKYIPPDDIDKLRKGVLQVST